MRVALAQSLKNGEEEKVEVKGKLGRAEKQVQAVAVSLRKFLPSTSTSTFTSNLLSSSLYTHLLSRSSGKIVF